MMSEQETLEILRKSARAAVECLGSLSADADDGPTDDTAFGGGYSHQQRFPREDGGAIKWWKIPETENPEFQVAVRDHLIASARKKLKKGTRFEIRRSLAGYYGHEHSMAWYTNEAMQAEYPEWSHRPSEAESDDCWGAWRPEIGVYVVGVFQV